MRYDLAIVGSGGAAFAAAIAARRKDKSVVMVESGATGGTCVNTGCVPSKALLAAAEARHVALDQRFPGVHTAAGPTDVTALVDSKAQLVAGMRAEKYVDLAAEHGWEIIAGAARFAPGPVVDVDRVEGSDPQRIEAEHYLVATGSTSTAPPIDGLEQASYLTSTTALELGHLPASMVVLGGNYIGLEMAQLFAHLGTQVTILEIADRLAPHEEPEVSEAIARVFTDDGIAVHTAATLTRIDGGPGGYTLTAQSRDGHQQTLHPEQLLIATGRRPVTDDLGLEDVGVTLGQHGQVLIDEHLRTANSRVWAAGDVTGAPQFVYVAGAHGNLVADNAFDGAGRTLDYRHLPRVTFTSPTIAAVGLTDQQANEQGLDCECRVLPLNKVPRALVNRDTRGLVKIVAERATGRVIGASMIADGAGDAIQAGVYAVKAGMTTRDMADTWAPYLTMAEALKLAAQTFHLDVAKLSCCAS